MFPGFLGPNRTGRSETGQGSGWRYNTPSVRSVFEFRIYSEVRIKLGI